MLGNLSAIKAFIVKNKAFLEQNIIMLERIDDIQTDMSQVCEYTNIYRDLLANSLDAFASVLNNNISDVMKIVGSISLILMIPTLIASFYGILSQVVMGKLLGLLYYLYHLVYRSFAGLFSERCDGSNQKIFKKEFFVQSFSFTVERQFDFQSLLVYRNQNNRW
jgi:hypothetical protein